MDRLGCAPLDQSREEVSLSLTERGMDQASKEFSFEGFPSEEMLDPEDAHYEG